MTMNKSLIDDLCNDLEPVKPMAHPLLRSHIIFLGIATYIVCASLFLGLRHDLATILTDFMFQFEIAVAGLIFLTALYAANLYSVPDARGMPWFAAIPLGLLFILGSWCGFRCVMEGMDLQVQEGVFWTDCVSKCFLLLSAPVALLTYTSSLGASTRPVLSAAMNIIAASAIGHIGVRMTCPADSVGYNVMFHIAPFVVFGVVIAMLTKRFYRW